ncbi:MAG: 23S rRNA (uracil(1939)-C(5))-methyltransferase RlmD [Acholeplasmataceae bacterium]|jgi:23S rRNA (uracil1939-C5)-methyltransferase|nr:23S rRNA (uracil(1939)-C(5))-methyltransferase RlmD [Acholeplasmataceae bacterium]
MEQHIKPHDTLNVSIKRMGINGEGIAYDQKLAIFVEGALPGEDVEIEIKEVFDNRATAITKNVLKQSKSRSVPFCPVYETCGGCQTQHMAYETTLAHKRDIILQSFDRYMNPKPNPNVVKKAIGSANPTFYRNKASLPVQKLRGKNVFGMYARNSNHFIPIDDCPIQHELINQILKSCILLMDQYQMDAMDPKTKKGYVRSIVVRVAMHTKEAQVSFIMLKKSNRLDDVAKALMKKEKHVVSVYEVMNGDLKKPGFFTDEMELILGKDTIIEHLNNQTFILKPEAFFQLNTEQADIFYKEMKRLAHLKKHEVAIDAYAGIAPVSHYIAGDAKHVYAIEIEQQACESAKLSLKENKIDNVTVLHSDFKRALSGLREKKIDVMFFDPPRVGLGEETINLIQKFKPSRLIYGSCNPSTLAKDLHILQKDYELIETVPIDMFPYTSLVESVSLLELKIKN